MSKFLVTGSSGFVGKNLINYLQNNSIQVLPFSRNLGMEYSQIDPIYLNNEDVEVIIHLAGKAHDLKNVSNNIDYYKVNTDMTICLFDAFLNSNAKIFIYMSSVKAVKDHFNNILTEEIIPSPSTAYGKSKLASENYLKCKFNHLEKKVYILRPCMIHGKGNKGNLNVLFNYVKLGLPWPLGKFINKRSYCGIDNLCFIINELIQNNNNISSDIFNIADDESISTNELISLIAESQGKNLYILNIPKFIIKSFTTLGDFLRLPFNSERLSKLTETFVVSNKKIKKALKKELPITAKNGLIKTLNSFGKSNTL